MTPPLTTADRVLAAGEPVGSGTESVYRRLREARGEKHRPRTEFVSHDPLRDHSKGPVLATIAHLTDLHMIDAQSPARVDFAMRDAVLQGMFGRAFRPQELLTAHAIMAMVDTVAELPIDIGILTGDNVNNAQVNEVSTYLALLDGGLVEPVSASGRYFGVQSIDFGDDWYWRPDEGSDRYKGRFGYPTVSGLIEAASQRFLSRGLQHPWLGCLGNHDVLVNGMTRATEALQAIAVGGSKPLVLPSRMGNLLEQFLVHPERLFGGPTVSVLPDPDRRFISPDEFVKAHLMSPGHPTGHGFPNTGETYYRYDATPEVRIIMLDTNHRAGYVDGSLSRDQIEWLRSELDGLRWGSDPFVVLASHHASPSLGNAYGVCADHETEVAYARELISVALDCPNVILWLNGHHHANRIAAHYRPAGNGGLFEVTTAAIADWPCQGRILELAYESHGAIRITSTMIDHAAPATPLGDWKDHLWLASLHRELAANEVWRGGVPSGSGIRDDRNVTMVLPAP